MPRTPPAPPGAPRKPTKQEQLAAADRTLPDILAPGLRVLFCGINPGLYTAATGHHFARPGNRFWPALHGAGFTPRRLTPDEDGTLPDFGLGITNVVDRATRSAAELAPAELRAGAVRLAELVSAHRPRMLAVVGIGAWRTGFDRPRAVPAPVPLRILCCGDGVRAPHLQPLVGLYPGERGL